MAYCWFISGGVGNWQQVFVISESEAEMCTNLSLSLAACVQDVSAA